MTGIDLSGGRTGKAPVVKLSSGYDLPVVGLGTYALHGNTCVNAVRTALESGYRLIDTASFYGNEREVGEGVRASGVPREEVVVQTKLYPNQYGHAARAIEECLSKLDLGYIDILLLHHPASNDVSAYRAIEQAIRDGKVRSAGISCYYIRELDTFLPQVDLKPVLVQNEVHPYYQDTPVVRHIQEADIPVQAWYPLGGRGFNRELMN